MQNNETELKNLLWDVFVYQSYRSWKIVVNNVYRSWIVSVTSVSQNVIKFFIFKNLPGRVSCLSWESTWEWKMLELVSRNCCNLDFSNSQRL